MNDVLSMRFDQYQRYRLVADVLEQVREDGRPLRVLDVGGRTGLLRRFLDDPVVLVDVDRTEEPGLVLGSGSNLPFRDDAFDVVCAFDTLEHVPVEGREAFVAECARVARRHVVLAGPYEAPEVVEAEESLQRFLLEKLGQRHRQLDEHRRHGLPDRARVEAQLERLGCTTRSIPHANLERWLVLQCVVFYLEREPALLELATALSRVYNRELYPSDHAEPVYRYVVVAGLKGAPLPTIDSLLQPPVAPAGVLDGFAGLASELAAFDRAREAWRTEREALLAEQERLSGAVQSLGQQLAGLRAEAAAPRGLLDRLLGTKHRS